MSSLKVIASGSKGNGYVLVAGDDVLVIEAGVRAKEIMRSIEFRVSGISGVLVSHGHGDHSKYIPEWQQYRIPVYSNDEVAEKYPEVRALEPKKKYRIGNFSVMPLEVPHDVKNYAYLVEHEDIGRLLFATDLTDFPYMIDGINHLCIECNYSEVLLDEAEDEDFHIGSEQHMEIEKCVELVERLWNPKMRTVTLLHLSSQFSDEAEFVRRVQEVSGYAVVTAADKGVEIDLCLTDF